VQFVAADLAEVLDRIPIGEERQVDDGVGGYRQVEELPQLGAADRLGLPDAGGRQGVAMVTSRFINPFLEPAPGSLLFFSSIIIFNSISFLLILSSCV